MSFSDSIIKHVGPQHGWPSLRRDGIADQAVARGNRHASGLDRAMQPGGGERTAWIGRVATQYTKHHQRGRALPVRRTLMHQVVAVGHGDGIDEFARMGGEVGLHLLAPKAPQVRDDACADLATIERVGPVAGDQAQPAGEVRLGMDLTQPCSLAAPQEQPAGLRVRPQTIGGTGLLCGNDIADGVAVLGIVDCWLQQLIESARAMCYSEPRPGLHHTRDGDRARSGRRHGLPTPRLNCICRGGRAPRAVKS
ncbi:MAG: hypothetical protein NT133_05345 [Alphaproteobacteria bacterium]|nr:hypothetical protein [Alphaproteobacteria bacterium]